MERALFAARSRLAGHVSVSAHVHDDDYDYADV
jgi:hypothetical protein